MPWPKQKYKPWSTNHYTENTNPLKTGEELRKGLMVTPPVLLLNDTNILW